MRSVLTVLLLCLVCCLAGLQNPPICSQAPVTKQPDAPRPAPRGQTPIEHGIDTPSHEKPGQSEEPQTGKCPHDWVDWLSASSTLIIAAFTVGMVIVIAIQIREYRTRERAWVTFVNPKLLEKTDRGRPDGYRVVGLIQNFGSTPATINRKFHFKSSEDKGKGLPAVPPYLKIDEPQTEYLMVPGAAEPAIVDIEQYEVLNFERLDIHLLGQIVYKDVFGRSHETRYCLRLSPGATAGKRPGFYPEGPPAYLKVT